MALDSGWQAQQRPVQDCKCLHHQMLRPHGRPHACTAHHNLFAPAKAPTAPNAPVPSMMLASHSTVPSKVKFEPHPELVQAQSCKWPNISADTDVNDFALAEVLADGNHLQHPYGSRQCLCCISWVCQGESSCHSTTLTCMLCLLSTQHTLLQPQALLCYELHLQDTAVPVAESDTLPRCALPQTCSDKRSRSAFMQWQVTRSWCLIEPHGEQSMSSTAPDFASADHLSAKACSPSRKVFAGHSDALAQALASSSMWPRLKQLCWPSKLGGGSDDPAKRRPEDQPTDRAAKRRRKNQPALDQPPAGTTLVMRTS